MHAVDPRMLSSIELPNTAVNFTFEPSEDGKRLYALSAAVSGRDNADLPIVLQIYDVSNPKHVRQLSTLDLKPGGIPGLKIDGAHVLVYSGRYDAKG